MALALGGLGLEDQVTSCVSGGAGGRGSSDVMCESCKNVMFLKIKVFMITG